MRKTNHHANAHNYTAPNGQKRNSGPAYKNAGHVYVLDNPSLPGMVKIGMTRRKPTVRVSELSSATGVPTPFRLRFYAKTKDCVWAEKRVHHILRNKRVNNNREFFHVSPEDAYSVIKNVSKSRIKTPVSAPTKNSILSLIGVPLIFGFISFTYIKLFEIPYFVIYILNVMYPYITKFNPDFHFTIKNVTIYSSVAVSIIVFFLILLWRKVTKKQTRKRKPYRRR